MATLVPPHDVHNQRHVTGTGPSPHSLILLGDNMLAFEREEYDPERGTWRGASTRRPWPVEPLTFGIFREQGRVDAAWANRATSVAGR